MDCTFIRMPANGSKAREDLQFMQSLVWFGKDILFTTNRGLHSGTNGFANGWDQQNIDDYQDWRRKMRFFLHDMEKDIKEEVRHLRTPTEQGIRPTPTEAYFIWKAWSWDVVIPMTFKVRQDVQQLISLYLMTTFHWGHNDVIIRAALRLCRVRRRFLPCRKMKEAVVPSKEEEARFLFTSKKKAIAAEQHRSAWRSAAAWTGAEDELRFREQMLQLRLDATTDELTHIRSMLTEMQSEPHTHDTDA